jgi:tetratricopeptide (TPR) repeat protein
MKSFLFLRTFINNQNFKSKMKNLALISGIVIILIASCSGPQKFVNRARSNISANLLEKASENIDSAKKYEANLNWPKTWFTIGDYYYTIYTAAPEEQKEFEDLINSYESYKKGIEMDTANKYGNISIEMKFPHLAGLLLKKGIDYLNDDQFKKSFLAFSGGMGLELMERYPSEAIDTTFLYYSGIAAYQSELYDTSIYYFNKALEYNFKPKEGSQLDVYLRIKQAYIMMNDTLSTIETLKKAYKKFPNETKLLNEMVIYYIELDKEQEALNYLKEAQSKDKDNPSYYFMEGTIHESLDEREKAIEAYKNAIEMNPNYFDAYYNLGAMFYNKGVEMLKAANDIDSHKEYEKAKNEADQEMAKAVPYLEKGLSVLNNVDEELKSKDEKLKDKYTTLSTLNTIYVRLDNEEKIKEIEEKIETVKEELGM